MLVAEAYCPTCGSSLDSVGDCELCEVERPNSHAAAAGRHLEVCRRCATPLERGTRVCDLCGADHPTSFGGLAPVAQLVLGLFLLAVVLAIASLLFGPIVP